MLYIFVSIYATFPVIFRLRTALYGSATDPFAWIWNFWWLKYSGLKGLPVNFVPVIAYPFGVEFASVSPVWTFFNKYLSIWPGEIASYNLQVMLSFLLSGLAMYLLVYYFTKSRISSFFSGLVFTLSPYHFIRAWEHLGLSNMHWMVFYILALFIANENRTYKSAIICGFWFALIGQFSNYYYIYFMILFTGLFFGFNTVSAVLKKRRFELINLFKNIKLLGSALGVAMIIILPAIWRYLEMAVCNLPKAQETGLIRSFGQLFADSARPLNYFLPAEYNPILGGLARFFIDTPLYGENNGGEQSLYLGIIPLFLAFIGYKKWRDKKDGSGIKCKDDFLIKFWGMTFLAFMICSFSPYWEISSNLFIPFPSYFLYKIFPIFRNYARMGVLVMMSVCVLAGFGLRQVLETVRSQGMKFILVSLLCCGVLFEFLNIPPYRITDANKIPEAYQWVKEQPENTVIAEYPLEADMRQVLFYQRMHKRSLINGAPQGTYAFEVMQKIKDIENNTTAGILSFLGANYVLVHKDKYRNYEGGRILGKVPDLSAQAGFKLEKKFPKVDIYKVMAKPVNPKTVEVSKEDAETKSREINFENLKNAFFAFTEGEKFVYLVKYMKIIPVARVKASIGKKEKTGGVDTIALKAELYMNAFISRFLKIDAKIVSLFDIKQLCSWQYKEISQVQGHRLNRKVVSFDQKKGVMTTKDRQVNIYPCTQDPLSAIFFLSSQEFEIGKKITVYLNPGKSNYKLQCQVLAKELLKRSKDTRHCWKVKAEYFQFKNGEKKIADVIMWFLDADKKTPILIKAITKIGFLTVELTDKSL